MSTTPNNVPFRLARYAGSRIAAPAGLGLVFWLLCASPGVLAQGPRTCLVLTGSGVHAAAGIGVLRALADQQIYPDCVVGSSQASLVAALYAVGYSAAEIEQIYLSADWSRFFFERSGNFEFSNFLAELFLLRQQTGDFDQLAHPARILAFDSTSLGPVVIRQGDLAMAVRSAWFKRSLAMILPRSMLTDRALEGFDVPGISQARELGADRVIVLHMLASVYSGSMSPIDQLVDLENAYSWQLAEDELALLSAADMLITPDTFNTSTSDFNRMAEVIETGYRAAAGMLAIQSQPRSGRPRATPAPRPSTYTLESLQITTDGVVIEEQEIFNVLGLAIGQQVDENVLMNAVRAVWDTGNFDEVWLNRVDWNPGGELGLRLNTRESRGYMSTRALLDFVLRNPRLLLRADLDAGEVEARVLDILRRQRPDWIVDGELAEAASSAAFITLIREFAPDLLVGNSETEILANLLRTDTDYSDALVRALQSQGYRAAPYARLAVDHTSGADPILPYRFLLAVTQSMLDEGATDGLPAVEAAFAALPDMGEPLMTSGIASNIERLKTEKRLALVRTLASEYPEVVYATAAIAGLLLVLSLLYLVAPLTLIRIKTYLASDSGSALQTLMDKLGLPLEYLTLVAFFANSERALNAWIERVLPAYEEQFTHQKTVADRSIMVPLPLLVDGAVQPAPSATVIRPLFRKRRTLVWIWGEGGSGKTALACEISRLLIDQRTLPLLIEPSALVEAGSDSLEDIARGMLTAFLELSEEINRSLFLTLLRRGKICVILDSYSELSPDQKTALNLIDPELSISKLMITSRAAPSLSIPVSEIKPLRVSGDHLSSFMEAYLNYKGVRAGIRDSDFFDICAQLTRIVGNRDFPVLLAKMFADLASDAEARLSSDNAPHNVPELMLAYVNYLNRLYDDGTWSDLIVQKSLRLIAWQCLRQHFVPGVASVEAIAATWEDLPDLAATLKFLENDLGVIRTTGAAKDKVSFTLDTLAEYLAAYELVMGAPPERLRTISNSPESMEAIAAATGFSRSLLDTLECMDLTGDYLDAFKTGLASGGPPG